MKKTALCFALAAASFAFYACQKDSSNETSTLKIRMTDAPLAVEEVNIDLKEVRVKLDRDTAQWQTLQTTAGIYNLLALQNGVDTLIAQGSLPTASVKEIRLILGSNNTIKVDGQTHPLTIPSGSESGLKIKIDKKLRASSIDSLLIDFDAALSVKRENDGYKLRPVIKLK
ncbi:MAG: hypothetical protein JWP69_504 [Flaviaesturariibacter sp.]|nr:hypothetical protein [Flaviaesturariibacter sp.]